MGDWFTNNAPQASSGDWFAQNAPLVPSVPSQIQSALASVPRPNDVIASASEEPGLLTGPLDLQAKHTLGGGDPAAQQTLAREVAAGAGTIAGIPAALYHAAVDKPTDEETAEAGGSQEVSGAKRIGLGIGRLTAEPVVNAAKWYGDVFKGKIPDPTDQALSVAPEAIGSAAGNVVAGKAAQGILEKTVSTARDLATRSPQAAVVPEAAGLPKAAVEGAEHLFRAAAPVGSDPSFRGNLYAAAGDLAEIGRKIDLAEAKGGTINPDMRVRATVQAVNNHLSDMYANERAPQITRNAQNPVTTDFGPDAANGLKFLARSAGTVADRNLAESTLGQDFIPLQDLDALARTTNKTLLDFESMTPAERATTGAINRRLASLKALDKELSTKVADELGRRGEPGISEYERRYAAVSSVRDQLQARMNMSELQRSAGPNALLNVIRKPSLAGASQAATANVNIGRMLQKGFRKLADSGIQPNRPVGTGAPPVRGLLTSGATRLPSQMEPIGQPSGPPPILPYQPSLQSPRQFVGPSEIKPAAPEPQLLNPNEPRDFPQGRLPRQGNLFQTSVSRESLGKVAANHVAAKMPNFFTGRKH